MSDLFEKVNYHTWANDRLLEHLSTLPKGIITTQVQSVFPSIAAALEHILTVDELWFDRMNGMRMNENDSVVCSDLETIRKKFNLLHNQLLSYASKLNDSNAIVSYKNSKGEQFENTLDEIIQHLINHGTYHRGNITAMLWQLGEKSISTDYIYFLRESSHLN